MKFVTLLKKELREMLSLTTIIGMCVGLAVFFILGQVMSGISADSSKDAGTVHLVDMDNSDLSKSSIAALEQAGFTVVNETPNTGAEGELAFKPQGDYDLLVIPEGFASSIQSGKPATIGVYSTFRSMGMSKMFSSGSSSAVIELINEAVSNTLIAQNLADGAKADPSFLKTPVVSNDITFVGENYSHVSASALSGFAMQQSMFVPLVVFILVIFASQMVSSAIATEKGDKTLETLLCTPVSRLSVLSAKMCGAGIVSLLMAAVYMVGFSSYMNGLMGPAAEGLSNSLGDSLTSLGITLSPVDYLLVGLQLFLTILIALAVSMILGALASDVKSAQTAITPLMFALLIPYLMTMFFDINTVAMPLRIFMYIIPFTHTFIASNNMIFDNYTLYFGGLLYQIIFLAVVMTLAIKLFSGDRIFTIRLNFGQKKKRKAQPVE
ncbi:MAG: ABC transporter permease [Oscillospiraceae bacterium]|jgi:ABC-2 type transport system permease protein